MLEDNCMRGGMSCERKCDYDTSESVCEEELTVSRQLGKDDIRLRNLKLTDGSMSVFSRQILLVHFQITHTILRIVYTFKQAGNLIYPAKAMQIFLKMRELKIGL